MFRIDAMTRAHAEDISTWQYPPPYDCYDMTGADPDDLMKPQSGYFALLDGNRLAGFRSFGVDGQVPGWLYDDSALDTGGGLRPELAGKGLGRQAIAAGLTFGRQRFHPLAFRMTIASFNVRARTVVESLAFEHVEHFIASTNERSYDVFVRSERLTASPVRTIRLARPAETAAVERLVHDAYQPYIARIGRRPAPMNADYQQAIQDLTVWVLDIGGQVCGVLVLTQDTDHLHIDNIAVDPQLQGAGAGSELLLHAEQQAHARGLTELRLYTNELMTENLRYYDRRGYLRTGRRVQDGYARVFFSKKLPTTQ